MKRAVLAAATCGWVLCLMASSSLGAIQFFVDPSDGNFHTAINNAGLTLENILVNKNDTGLIVSGQTNKTAIQFDIQGDETLINTANGQATVEGLDGNFTSGSIFGHDLPTTFQALELSVTPDAKAGGTYMFSVFGNFPNGPSTSTTFTTSHKQFVGVLATGGDILNLVTITSATSDNIADLKQIRVAGRLDSAHVPEPTSLAVWALNLGVCGVGLWLRRRRRRARVA